MAIESAKYRVGTKARFHQLKIVSAWLIVAAGLAACSDDRTPEERAQATCEDRILTYIYAQNFIKDRLAAPTTARFPSVSNVNHTYLGDCTHRYVGALDAQNSFGAMLRAQFDATVQYEKDEMTYYLLSVNIQ